MPKTKCDHCHKEHECPHCWHSTGRILTSMPPQQEEYCCFCDTKITITMCAEQMPDKPQEHGKFLVPASIVFKSSIG